ncbi:hypothetical protein GOP47_0031195, partial [Adiantum capillus-veneris]
VSNCKLNTRSTLVFLTANTLISIDLRKYQVSVSPPSSSPSGSHGSLLTWLASCLASKYPNQLVPTQEIDPRFMAMMAAMATMVQIDLLSGLLSTYLEIFAKCSLFNGIFTDILQNATQYPPLW